MAHGMSSGKKMIGASATHAAAAEFLFRGYNVAFPEFDMGCEDDLLVFSPENNKISRIQVRSKQTGMKSNGEDGYSVPVITPIELTQNDENLDYLVIGLRYCSQWILGLFDEVLMKKVMDAGVGSYTEHVGQKSFEPRARVIRMSGKVLFSGVDVSSAFSHTPNSKWDDFFPVRIADVKRPLHCDTESSLRPSQRPDIANSFLAEIDRMWKLSLIHI